MNILQLGKGSTAHPDGLWEQLRAVAAGFKIHEDWGATPAALDMALSVAGESGVQVAIHTDTLNEAGFLESTLDAVKNRSVNAFHTEGAGGGHAPDILRVVAYDNVLPSSTNPTLPHTVNTFDEHLDMLMVAHHLKRSTPEDLAFAGCANTSTSAISAWTPAPRTWPVTASSPPNSSSVATTPSNPWPATGGPWFPWPAAAPWPRSSPRTPSPPTASSTPPPPHAPDFRRAIATRSPTPGTSTVNRHTPPASAEPPRALPPRDGVFVEDRFRAALGFQPF